MGLPTPTPRCWAFASVSALLVLAACARHQPTPSPEPWIDEPAPAPSPTSSAEAQRVLFDQPSSYGRVIVVQQGSRRCLKFAMVGGDQSCIDVDHPTRIVHEYVRYLSVGLLFVPRSPRCLMVGLGGGRAVRMFLDADPQLELDVVEINPTVVDVAREFFDIAPSERLRIHVADGRQYFQDRTERWDLIMLDAFGNDFIPFHLTTKEFLQLVAQHLTKDGVLLANLWTNNGPLYRAMVRTYHEVFPQLSIFKAERAGNAIIAASLQAQGKSCEQIKALAAQRQSEFNVPFDYTVAPGRCQPLETLDLSKAAVLVDSQKDAYERLRERAYDD